MSHTPGPWKVLEHSEDMIGVIDAAGGFVVEDFNWQERCAPHNAALTAAAPDLLASLKALHAEINGTDRVEIRQHLTSIESAIAKAEGK